MRSLLRLYPSRWRERYGEEFALILETTPPGPRVVFDVVRGALDAHLRAARPGRVLHWALLAFCAAVVAWLNFHATDDVQPVAAALLVFGFGFGAYRPRWAWRYALVLFAAVPLSGVWAAATHDLVSPWQLVSVYESIVALIPAFLGVCTGAAVGWGLRRARAD